LIILPLLGFLESSFTATQAKPKLWGQGKKERLVNYLKDCM
jgi:hypothetical protein